MFVAQKLHWMNLDRRLDIMPDGGGGWYWQWCEQASNSADKHEKWCQQIYYTTSDWIKFATVAMVTMDIGAAHKITANQWKIYTLRL